MESTLDNDLFIIGRVSLTKHGDKDVLNFEDYDRVYRIIQKHSTMRTTNAQQDFILRRMSILKKYSGDELGGCPQDYRDMVQ